MKHVAWIVLCAVAVASHADGRSIHLDYPEKINPDKKYVIYLHGKIVEGEGPIPPHKRWGQYEYDSILESLSDPEYDLIAVRRPLGTDSVEYAQMLARLVDSYISQGLDPSHLVILGFSKGGAIAILLSDYLKQAKLTTILLAACASWTEHRTAIQLYGKVYSIFEQSDRVGTCESIVSRSRGVTVFDEVMINTGREHGAFYSPLEDWVIPVKSWIKQSNMN